MKASLIITVYKDVTALKAILRSVELQSEKDFEIIIAQDADDNCFKSCIDTYINKGYHITLLQQEDKGFQKNKILNKAIISSASDKLIFIDGDCVLHPEFIKQHILHLKKGSFCAGNRVDLDAKTSSKIRENKITTPRIFQMLFNGSNRVEEAFRFLAPFLSRKKAMLLGCNMSWNKEDLLLLNGFDEDYKTPGYGEDTDIEYRAISAGLTKINTRYRTVQYHLFHERPEREDQVAISRELYNQKKHDGKFRCENGIEKS